MWDAVLSLQSWLYIILFFNPNQNPPNFLQSVCEPTCSSPLFFTISLRIQFYKFWAYFLYPAYCTNYVRHVLDNPFRYHSTNNQSTIKGRSYSSFHLIRCTIFGVIEQTRYPLCVPLKPQCNSQKKDEKYPSIISGSKEKTKLFSQRGFRGNQDQQLSNLIKKIIHIWHHRWAKISRNVLRTYGHSRWNNYKGLYTFE